MEQIYLEKKDCCACSACFNVCPTDSITMTSDSEGFLYPVIAQDLCIDCNRCREVCPLITEGSYKEESIPEFYVAKHKNVDVLNKSTSGGAFTALSDAILAQDGIVYGVDFDDEYRVLHRRSVNYEERNRMRISKYVQSDMTNIFQEVKKDLENGKKVLFTGTPCQNAGLRGYLSASNLTKNLYSCDVICHSIPSPLIWEDYKRLLEKEHGGILTDVQFRSKIIEWSRENSNNSFLFKTSSSEKINNDDRYYRLWFGTRTVCRPSCYDCHFTDIHRASDITVADYWGIEKYAPEWMDVKGVSVILVNTHKGEELLHKCDKSLEYEKRPMEESLNEQQRLSEPTKIPENRAEFWQDYEKFGFEYIIDNLK